MKDDNIIEIKGIGKRYSLQHTRGGYVALRDVMANILKSPFRFTKDKVKRIIGTHNKEDFWALKNISVNIKRGEIIGIIGKNGAGKSTLLKILSQITPPTEGEIILNGKVGSLLEVGTGFHPELTGKENIFLNGAILGMTKKEIISKFDEIVEFAGISQFLDTPVKHYSSGMYVRLAFSVAAHMEPDILIVDEVLAVGDAEFQRKSLGKMKDVTQNNGRTILFVSHNMGAIKNLCTKTILLENGQIKAFGETDKIVNEYLTGQTVDLNSLSNQNDTNKEIIFRKIRILNEQNNQTNLIRVDEKFNIELEFEVRKDVEATEISVFFRNSNGVNVTFTNLSDSFEQKLFSFKPGKYRTHVYIDKFLFVPDKYFLGISAHKRGIRSIDSHENVATLDIVESGSTMMNYGPAAKTLAVFISNAVWRIDNINDK